MRERERTRWSLSFLCQVVVVDSLDSKVRSEVEVIQEAFVIMEDGGSSRIHLWTSEKSQNALEKQKRSQSISGSITSELKRHQHHINIY